MPPTESPADALGADATRKLTRALWAVFPHDTVADIHYDITPTMWRCAVDWP